jgi:hypothetical protein
MMCRFREIGRIEMNVPSPEMRTANRRGDVVVGSIF